MGDIRFDAFAREIAGHPTVTQFKNILDGSGRFDAAIDTSLVARQLLYLRKTVYEYRYPTLKATQVIPTATDAPPGADFISTFLSNGVGQAKIIANHADDLPRVDMFGSEDVTPVKTLGDAYAYSIMDLQRAAFTGIPLDSMRAMWALRGINQSIEDIAAVGDVNSGLPGMLNNASVPIDAVTTPWASATAAQILADMARAVSNMIAATNGAEMPDTLLLPTAYFAIANQIPYSTLNGQTVLSVFKANNPYITTVDTWIKLDTAGAGGIKRIVAYRKAPDVLTLELPLAFQQLAPQPRNLDFVVNCIARIGGVKIRYPLAMRYMDGS